jgi:hypothetical protein
MNSPNTKHGQQIVVALHSHRLDFLALQHHSVKHFIKNAAYLPIINAFDKDIEAGLIGYCEQNEIKYIRSKSLNPKYFTPNQLCGEGMNFFWHGELADHLNHVMLLLDSDCFLIAPFCPTSFLDGAPLAAPKVRREANGKAYNHLHPWPAVFDLKRLPNVESINWHMTIIDNAVLTDNFGESYNYLANNPWLFDQIKTIHWSGHICHENNNLSTIHPSMIPYYNNEYRIEIFEQNFLHFARGSNWAAERPSVLKAKWEFTEVYVNAAILGKLGRSGDMTNHHSATHGWA